MQQPQDTTPARWLFAVLLTVLGALLLSQITEQTKWIEGMSVAAQPRSMPFLALLGLSVFAAASAVIFWRQRRPFAVGDELATWLRPGEYALYFMLYVNGVAVIGYGFATIIFCALLARRAGLNGKQCTAAGLSGLAIVVVFKGMLSVKIPGAPFYETLPAALRNLLILYF